MKCGTGAYRSGGYYVFYAPAKRLSFCRCIKKRVESVIVLRVFLCIVYSLQIARWTKNNILLFFFF